MHNAAHNDSYREHAMSTAIEVCRIKHRPKQHVDTHCVAHHMRGWTSNKRVCPRVRPLIGQQLNGLTSGDAVGNCATPCEGELD